MFVPATQGGAQVVVEVMDADNPRGPSGDDIVDTIIIDVNTSLYSHHVYNPHNLHRCSPVCTDGTELSSDVYRELLWPRLLQIL